MIKFDYLQFRTEVKHIEIDESKFDTILGDRAIQELDRKQLSASTKSKLKSTFDIPANRIKVDIIGPYLSLGITSKLLCSDYQELISKETIADCLQSLVKHGIIVDIDVKSIISEAKITVAEITKDLIHSNLLSAKDYEFFSQAVFNPYRWNPKVWDYGFGLSKEVKAHKEFLSIYNKAEEMNLPRSKNYNDRYLTHNPFSDDKSIRIEGRFFSAKSIKKHFGENSATSVLNHESNVLQSFAKKVLINPQIFSSKKYSKPNHKNLAFAKRLDYDPKRIADAVNIKSKHNRVRKYRDIMNSVMILNDDNKISSKNLEELLNNIK